MKPLKAVVAGLAVIFFGFLTVSAYIASASRPGPSSFTQTDSGPLYYYSGAIHCHTVYSDGSGTIGDVARAALAAGCDFVITSDHNTIAPRTAGEEGYRGPVLVLCDQEVSTTAGHLLALDCPIHLKASEYKTVQAIVDTVRALGGIVFPAHPFLKKKLWTEWELTGIDGFELFNFDVEWRNDSPFETARALLFLRLFPDAAFNGLVDRPTPELELLDTGTADNPLTAIAAVDAHARIKLTGSRILRFPSYESMFRLFQTCLITEEPFSGRYERDRRLVYDALRRGSCYSACSGLGDPRGLRFEAMAGSDTARMGEALDAGGPVMISASVQSGDPVVMELYRDGEVAAVAEGRPLTVNVTEPGTYRLEVYKKRNGLFKISSFKLPWIYSNPIYLR
jgi:hypothetical protein